MLVSSVVSFGWDPVYHVLQTVLIHARVEKNVLERALSLPWLHLDESFDEMSEHRSHFNRKGLNCQAIQNVRSSFWSATKSGRGFHYGHSLIHIGSKLEPSSLCPEEKIQRGKAEVHFKNVQQLAVLVAFLRTEQLIEVAPKNTHSEFVHSPLPKCQIPNFPGPGRFLSGV
jgi:hypothetical protein